MNLATRFNSTKATLLAGLAAVVAVGSPAFAAIDVTAVTTEIGTAAAPIAAIGGAVLLVLVGVKTYKWIRRSL